MSQPDRSPTETHEHLRRWAFAAAKRADLTQDERNEFATILLLRDVSSWSELSSADLQRVVDGLRGAHYVAVIHEQRGLPRA